MNTDIELMIAESAINEFITYFMDIVSEEADKMDMVPDFALKLRASLEATKLTLLLRKRFEALGIDFNDPNLPD